ncbi:MAG: hypothetical protein E7228_00095 [Clostridiales bacterium]|nr:hypothetical protein [Clostridiales bacterium]
MKAKTSLFGKAEERKTTDDNYNSKSFKSFFSGKIGTKFSKSVLIAGVSLLVLAAGFGVLFTQSSGYAVYYDEAFLGFVDKPETVIDNLEDINEAISLANGVEMTMYERDFSFEKSFQLFADKNNWEEIALAANERCSLDANVYEIYIDDVMIAQDSSIDNITSIMEQLKEEYTAANPQENFSTINFVQKIEIRVKKGDKPESADPEVLYASLKDILTVKTTAKIVEEKAVPFEIVYEYTDTKACGDVTVKSAGVDGKMETVTMVEKHDGMIVASTEVSSKVLSEKVDQVVLVGTKGMVVSDAGMITPSRGSVTSQMGSRWGRTHKGIDVPGDTGDPIFAAKEGTVTVAEYKNNGYGNVIEIDHGNGLVTLYAHLNSISVKPGDVVYPGQIIGGMGTTGRSTGVHLHFEVLVNGSNVNPLNYVKY